MVFLTLGILSGWSFALALIYIVYTVASARESIDCVEFGRQYMDYGMDLVKRTAPTFFSEL